MKKAVDIAGEALASLYPAKILNDVLLEEVERSANGADWFITLGFSRPKPPVEAIGSNIGAVVRELRGENYTREYRTFIINADSGEFKGMKKPHE